MKQSWTAGWKLDRQPVCKIEQNRTEYRIINDSFETSRQPAGSFVSLCEGCQNNTPMHLSL